MRSTVSALAFGVLLALFPRGALAQPTPHYTSAALMGTGTTTEALVTVETEWRTTPSGRSTTVVARLAARSLSLHEGATVDTAIAAQGDHLCVATIHGGDRGAFARAWLVHRDGGQLILDAVVGIPRELAIADGRPRFPASVLVAATAQGFAVMVQHQERDPSANVVTTLTVLANDGRVAEATHVVAVPWALSALVADGDGYQLAVSYGGSGTGTLRLCLVHLSGAGSPTEHPWWASPAMPPSDVQLLHTSDGATVAAWMDPTGAVVGQRFSAPGRWSAEPPAPVRYGAVDDGAAAWMLTERAGAVTVISAR